MDGKKIILVTTGVLAIGAAIWIGYWLLTTGTLHVTTQDDAVVELIEMKDGERTKTQIGTGDTRKRLEEGQYTVRATVEARGSSQQTVTITPRETLDIDLGIQPMTNTEKLSDGASYNIEVASNTIRFVDTKLQLVYELEKGKDKATPRFHDLYPVTSVHWADINDALVQTRGDRFSVIKNDKVKDFRYPQGVQPEADFLPQVVSITTNDAGQLGLNIEGAVYIYDTPTSQPRKLRDLPQDNTSIALANNGAVFGYTDTLVSRHGEADIHNLLIDNQGQQQELSPRLKNAPVTFAAWSPDSSKLLIETEGGLFVYTPGSQKWQPFMQHSPRNVQSVLWHGNETIFLVLDGGLWKASAATHKLEKIADLPGPVHHNDPFTVHNDAVYFSTTPSGDFSRPGALYKAAF